MNHFVFECPLQSSGRRITDAAGRDGGMCRLAFSPIRDAAAWRVLFTKQTPWAAARR